ncbi:MAG: hypothetical protein NT098_00770 [Candidatus Parcubacteria bacterium]|nr:hypothetical protein [Candidatus Parcubacteria bacterium]
MSTKQKKVPVVTYTLLEKIETRKTQKEKQRTLETSYRAGAKKQQVLLQKQKAEREQLHEVKRILREEIKRTHVIPSFVFENKRKKVEDQKKALEFSFVEQHRQKKLAEDILKEQKEQAFRLKQFRKELHLAKVVPLEVKKLSVLFEESEIGKAQLLECEKEVVPVLQKLAKIVGFDVELDEFGDKTALIMWKPYPYWRYAFSNKNSEISHG